MAIPSYPSASDAGILFVILANTVISISCVKEFICSALTSVGIPLPSWGDDDNSLDSTLCIRASNDVFVDEFRSQTPAIPYKSIPALDGPAQECTICLTEFNRNARVNRLSCGHVFHKSCLEKWLGYWNPTCPLCRNDMMVVKETKEVVGEEEEDGDGYCTTM